MRIEASDPDDYISKCPEDRQAAISQLRAVINANIPEGFREEMSYGMIGWVIPHEVYPPGYHCDTSLPLPFLSIASQKNFIGFYHMGIYTDQDLLSWFTEEYKKVVSTKMDMGKSCLRLKKMDQIPFELLGELVSRMSSPYWIDKYESAIKR